MSENSEKSSIKVVADSSCDIFSVPEVNFSSVPLTIFTEEKTFCDDESIDVDGMLSYLASYKGRSYTSCPSVDNWIESFGTSNEIYVVTLSSNLSGSYNSALSAAKIYQERNPDAKVQVFDSRSAASEVRLIIEKIAEYVKINKKFEEICNLIDNYLKRTRIFFALESFHNFIQNGRVNKIIGKLAGIFGIRIMATGNSEGKIEIIKKFRGIQNTVNAFLDCIKNAGFNGGKCYIAHCKNFDLANQIAKKIREKYNDVKMKIYETRGLCSYYAEKGGIILSCECNEVS